MNNAPDDNAPDAVNGCTTLFIYWLHSQLGYGINAIVAAGAATLAGVYRNLSGDPTDPFPYFKKTLDDAFPSLTNSHVARRQPGQPVPHRHGDLRAGELRDAAGLAGRPASALAGGHDG